MQRSLVSQERIQAFAGWLTDMRSENHKKMDGVKNEIATLIDDILKQKICVREIQEEGAASNQSRISQVSKLEEMMKEAENSLEILATGKRSVDSELGVEVHKLYSVVNTLTRDLDTLHKAMERDTQSSTREIGKVVRLLNDRFKDVDDLKKKCYSMQIDLHDQQSTILDAFQKVSSKVVSESSMMESQIEDLHSEIDSLHSMLSEVQGDFLEFKHKSMATINRLQTELVWSQRQQLRLGIPKIPFAPPDDCLPAPVVESETVSDSAGVADREPERSQINNIPGVKEDEEKSVSGGDENHIWKSSSNMQRNNMVNGGNAANNPQKSQVDSQPPATTHHLSSPSIEVDNLNRQNIGNTTTTVFVNRAVVSSPGVNVDGPSSSPIVNNMVFEYSQVQQNNVFSPTQQNLNGMTYHPSALSNDISLMNTHHGHQQIYTSAGTLGHHPTIATQPPYQSTAVSDPHQLHNALQQQAYLYNDMNIPAINQPINNHLVNSFNHVTTIPTDANISNYAHSASMQQQVFLMQQANNASSTLNANINGTRLISPATPYTNINVPNASSYVQGNSSSNNVIHANNSMLPVINEVDSAYGGISILSNNSSSNNNNYRNTVIINNGNSSVIPFIQKQQIYPNNFNVINGAAMLSDSHTNNNFNNNNNDSSNNVTTHSIPTTRMLDSSITIPGASDGFFLQQIQQQHLNKYDPSVTINDITNATAHHQNPGEEDNVTSNMVNRNDLSNDSYYADNLQSPNILMNLNATQQSLDVNTVLHQHVHDPHLINGTNHQPHTTLNSEEAVATLNEEFRGYHPSLASSIKPATLSQLPNAANNNLNPTSNSAVHHATKPPSGTSPNQSASNSSPPQRLPPPPASLRKFGISTPSPANGSSGILLRPPPPTHSLSGNVSKNNNKVPFALGNINSSPFIPLSVVMARMASGNKNNYSQVENNILNNAADKKPLGSSIIFKGASPPQNSFYPPTKSDTTKNIDNINDKRFLPLQNDKKSFGNVVMNQTIGTNAISGGSQRDSQSNHSQTSNLKNNDAISVTSSLTYGNFSHQQPQHNLREHESDVASVNYRRSSIAQQQLPRTSSVAASIDNSNVIHKQFIQQLQQRRASIADSVHRSISNQSFNKNVPVIHPSLENNQNEEQTYHQMMHLMDNGLAGRVFAASPPPPVPDI